MLRKVQEKRRNRLEVLSAITPSIQGHEMKLETSLVVINVEYLILKVISNVQVVKR